MKNLEQRVQALLARNKKVKAIKLVHRSTDWGLVQSKKYVDTLAAGGTPQMPKTNLSKDELLSEVHQLLAQGKKVHAVQLVRKHMMMGLREAKEYVESLE